MALFMRSPSRMRSVRETVAQPIGQQSFIYWRRLVVNLIFLMLHRILRSRTCQISQDTTHYHHFNGDITSQLVAAYRRMASWIIGPREYEVRYVVSNEIDITHWTDIRRSSARLLGLALEVTQRYQSWIGFGTISPKSRLVGPIVRLNSPSGGKGANQRVNRIGEAISIFSLNSSLVADFLGNFQPAYRAEHLRHFDESSTANNQWGGLCAA
jgi:hypothetical protein